MSTPIVSLQAKVVRFNKRILAEPRQFTERIGILAEAVHDLNSKPRVMVTQPNLDQLARIFNAVLDLAHYMEVDGESLILIAGKRLEIDTMQQKSKELVQ